jgi:hypothetical protein
MKVGTIVKASRKQINILVLFDDGDRPTPYRHDDVINRVAGLTDMLDGRGVSAGMRVEQLPESKLRLTGEVVEVEPSEEHAAPSSDKSPRQLHAGAMAGTNQDRIDRYFSIQGPPMDPDDYEELLHGK